MLTLAYSGVLLLLDAVYDSCHLSSKIIDVLHSHNPTRSLQHQSMAPGTILCSSSMPPVPSLQEHTHVKVEMPPPAGPGVGGKSGSTRRQQHWVPTRGAIAIVSVRAEVVRKLWFALVPVLLRCISPEVTHLGSGVLHCSK